MLERFDLVLEHTATGIVVTNREGVIEYVNPAFEKMSGYTLAMVRGKTPRVWQSGVHTPQFYDRLWKTIREGREFHAIVTNKRRDGRFFEQEQTISPIRGCDGEITHFVSASCDVSSEYRARQQRLQLELDREAMRVARQLHDELGQFLALAHMTIANIVDGVPPSSAERLQEVRRYLDHMEERLRESAHGVKRPVIAELSVIDAIRLLAVGYERQLGVPAVVTAPSDLCCPASIESLLYRTAHDALVAVTALDGTSRLAIDIRRQVGGRRMSDIELCCTITSWRKAATAADEETLTGSLAEVQAQLANIGGVLSVSSVGKNAEVRAALPFAA